MKMRAPHRVRASLAFGSWVFALFLASCSSWLGNPPDSKGTGTDSGKGTTPKVEVEKQASSGSTTVRNKSGAPSNASVNLTSAYVSIGDAFFGSMSPNPFGQNLIFDILNEEFIPRSPSFFAQVGAMTLVAKPADASVIPEMAGLTVAIAGTYTLNGQQYPLDIRYSFEKSLKPVLKSEDLLSAFQVSMAFDRPKLFDFSQATIDLTDFIEANSAILISDDTNDPSSLALKDTIAKNLEACFSYAKAPEGVPSVNSIPFENPIP